TNYTVTDTIGTDKYTFVVNIPWTTLNAETEEYEFIYPLTMNEIVVTYSAIVNEGILTAAPMENKGTYNFKSVPDEPDKPEEEFITPDPKKPWKETDSYSTKLSLKKVDGSDNTTLAGAKFKIEGAANMINYAEGALFQDVGVGADGAAYYMLKDGTFTDQDPILEDTTVDNVTKKANVHLYDSTDKKYALVSYKDITKIPTSIVKEGWVGSDGIMTFTGLGEGEYVITELVAPDGYNLLTAPITVVVTFDEGTETTAPSFSAKLKDATTNLDMTDNVISLIVANNSGTELPSTGGIGTTIFYIAGAILAVGAAIVLFAKKRVSED
ncbi:MAG: SpaA isopeptide-forming pilin-related protein, partial [Eubacteriales bacterium]|nr:SpaA isopeptide-forming pilin-related protein [Eubacteriales bacterium]